MKKKSFANLLKSFLLIITLVACTQAENIIEKIVVEGGGIAAPIIETEGGEYNLDTFSGVEITSAAGDIIRYTTDNTDPDANSKIYTGKITFQTAGTYVVKAIAIRDNEKSTIVGKIYILKESSNVVASPTVTPKSGTYKESLFPGIEVTSDTGAKTYYTKDGSDPTENSSLYTKKITLSKGTYNYKFKSFKSGFTASSVIEMNYVINESGPGTLTDVVIKFGTDELEVGGAAYRFTGEAKYDTGTSREDVNWEVSDTSLATITYDGTLSAVKAGTVYVYAELDGVKSDPYEVTIIDNSYDGFQVYYKSTSAPTIWAWEDANPSGDEGDIPLTTGWPGPSMSPVSGVTDWYVYKIPSSELTAGMPYEIKIIFNGTGEETYDKSKTWYDGSWHAKNPDGPQPPSVTASPAGGIKPAGTYSVTLKVEGDSVQESKYTIDGSNPSTNGIDYSDGDSINITLSQGSSITLKLYAKNSEGYATQTYTFTEGEAPKSVFSWDNINCYFVLTDRFENGDTENDLSYGRECYKDGTPISNSNYQNRPGTFNGGDLKGLTQKVNDDYFTDLGVNAIWISSPLEQIHGWVAGGGPSGSFKHYGYHGYYVLDPTEIDANMGTEQEFIDFVNAAHSKDIRVVIDVVLNHLGYENMQDMYEFNYGGFKTGWDDYYYNATDSSANWDNGLAPKMDFGTSNWSQWWGGDWVRKNDIAGGYEPMGQQPKGQYNFNLPDLKTESGSQVDIPPVLVTKWGGTSSAKYKKEKQELDDFFSRTGKSRTPRNYMIKWLTDFIREYGVDGFRLDTVNNLDIESVRDLVDTSKSEFNYVKQNNPDLLLDPAAEFWMTGEAYDHGVGKSNLFTEGHLDSAINFDFPKDGNLGSIGGTWEWYAKAINNDSSFNVLSYLSSHDKGLARPNMKNAGTALLLSPGGVQIFYGDETARPASVGGEPGWRSKMNWGSNQDILKHWQKVGSFRRDHVAVGAGQHSSIGNDTYSRTYSKNGIEDKVIIRINANGSTGVDVSSVFGDGTNVRNAYNGETGTVSGGSVTFTAENGLILIEEIN